MGKPQQWFQAVAVLRGVEGEARAQKIHAKEFGTLITACGIQSGTLHKEWSRAFQPDDSRACSACRAVWLTSTSTTVFVFTRGEWFD